MNQKEELKIEEERRIRFLGKFESFKKEIIGRTRYVRKK